MSTESIAAPAVVSRQSLGSLKAEQLSCWIGAELSNVSLADAARDDALFAEIKALLLKHRVLFLREQQISRAEHVAFAGRFGQLEDHPVLGSDPDHPGLVRIYKDLTSPPEHYENGWHCDATWREAPAMGAVLRCIDCPADGGDTIWSNMVKAYEDLPDHIKDKIAPLRASHSIEATFGAVMPIEQRHALKAQYPDAEHPVVRTHPETGEKWCCSSAASPLTSRTSDARQTSRLARTSPRRLRPFELPDRPRGVRPPGALARSGQRRHLGQPRHPALRSSRTTGRRSAKWSAPASSATVPTRSFTPAGGRKTMNFLDDSLCPRTRKTWSSPSRHTARNGCRGTSPRTCRSR